MKVKYMLLDKIKDGSFALLTDREICHKLRLGRRESYAVSDMLHALCREGELLCDSLGRFGTAEQFGAKVGLFTGNARGFGFVTPQDGESDLFIPHRNLNGALHGDTVLALKRNGPDGDEGEILAVLSHGFREIVGVYRREGKAGFLVPDEKKYSAEIYIPSGKNKGCPNGSKAIARLTSFGEKPVGEIIEVLGKNGDFFTEEKALIRAHGLKEEFPAEVLREADKAVHAIFDRELEGRIDLRNELIVTVDGEDTRDIDDAISVWERNGKFYLGVHIADVTHYVKRGSALDREAFERGTSVYFPDRVLPMLPPALSNGICSLNENEDRLTFSCLMTIDQKGRVENRKLVPSVIRSRHRLTYDTVTKIAEKDPEISGLYPDLREMLSSAFRLTEILKSVREQRGSVTLDLKETKILFEDGKITVPDFERTISHEMIEQFMILANECVAAFAEEWKIPFVYRIHEPPSEDKAREFADFLSGAGIRYKFDPAKVTPKEFHALLKSVEGDPLGAVINRVMLRSMSKARYSPENVGHFGLASDRYCHFTSPIRRYPDLCIHRILKEALKSRKGATEHFENFVGDTSNRSSERERNAQEAEREVDALYLTAYMQDKIGEEYEATISGVTAYGLYAELKNTVEGYIPVETLPEDYYEFSEEHRVLKGLRHVYRLGERIKIKVVVVDWGARRTQFIILDQIR